MAKYTVYEVWQGNPREAHPYRVVTAETREDAEKMICDHRGFPPRGQDWYADARPYRKGDEDSAEYDLMAEYDV